MRNVYSLNEQQELAWGFDHTSGFFIQLFDEKIDENEPVIDADQSEIIGGFLLSNEPLTYQKMNDLLQKHHTPAFQAFKLFMTQPLPLSLNGHIFNALNSYEKTIHLSTYRELFHFVDSVKQKYAITDHIGSTIDLPSLFSYLSKQATA